MTPVIGRASLGLRCAGLIAGAAAAALLLSACGGSAAGPSASPGAGTPSASGSQGTASPAPSSPAQATATETGLPAGYLPLFPFTSLTDAQAWEASYRSGGHQPWHLNADMTATAFALGLGYSDVTEVAGHTGTGSDAHVAVGVKLPNGHVAAAAVVHLLRFGTGQYAPWEVVGTDDTTFSLDSPGYGSTVSSPVAVGGKITGVDENITVQVRTTTTQGPVGTYCCQPAGGTNTPWSATVTFHATGQVLTIAASTGGHVAAVERFAVTGVRAS
jgi:hypothetical protein